MKFDILVGIVAAIIIFIVWLLYC